MTYEELIKRISPTLKRITHRLNGRFSFFNEEDLFQEALMHLWVSFKEGKLNDKTDSYVLQGCYFHLKNYLRKVQERVDLISIDSLCNEEGSLDLEEALCLENPESCIDYLENRMLLNKIENNGLTKREKEVLSLLLDGLTVRQIGKRLGISHVRVVKIKANIVSKSKKA